MFKFFAIVITGAALIPAWHEAYYGDFSVLAGIFIVWIIIGLAKYGENQPYASSTQDPLSYKAKNNLVQQQGNEMANMLGSMNKDPAQYGNTTITRNIYGNNGEAHIRMNQTRNKAGASTQTTDIAGKYVKDGKIHKTYHHDVIIDPHSNFKDHQNNLHQQGSNRNYVQQGEWSPVHHIHPTYHKASDNYTKADNSYMSKQNLINQDNDKSQYF